MDIYVRSLILICKKLDSLFLPTFGIQIVPALNSARIKVQNIQANSVLNVPPWTINSLKYFSHLIQTKKKLSIHQSFRGKFQELTSQYLDFQQIYTDGSKDG